MPSTETKQAEVLLDSESSELERALQGLDLPGLPRDYQLEGIKFLSERDDVIGIKSVKKIDTLKDKEISVSKINSRVIFFS